MSQTVKVAVFADIHSNKKALEACVKDAKMLGATEFIVAGDIISDWHEPNETINIIKELTPLVIKGNKEQAICEYKAVRELWDIYDEYASLLWTYKELTSDNLDYINNLPKVLTCVHDELAIRVVHGSPFSVNEAMYLENDGENRIKTALGQIPEDVLIFSHTHQQCLVREGIKIAVNPGSVGCHYNSEQAAEYCVLEITNAEITNVLFRKVKYDYDKYFLELLQSPLYKAAFVHVLIIYLGMCEGRNVLKDFLSDIEIERSKDEFAGTGPIPNDIYNRVFDDKYQGRVASKLFMA